MTTKSPWLYIPSLYFLEGLPYIIINTVSVVLYADLGYNNDQIAFWTGWLYLPWILKMFWSPMVDGRSTKRRWLLWAQLLMAGVFLALAALNAFNAFAHAQAANNINFFALSLFGLLAGAFVSATLDIATDGYYLLALTAPQQGYFVGIRTIFYRLAMILGSGMLISATGALANTLPKYQNWTVMFIFLAVLSFLKHFLCNIYRSHRIFCVVICADFHSIIFSQHCATCHNLTFSAQLAQL